MIATGDRTGSRENHQSLHAFWSKKYLLFATANTGSLAPTWFWWPACPLGRDFLVRLQAVNEICIRELYLYPPLTPPRRGIITGKSRRSGYALRPVPIVKSSILQNHNFLIFENMKPEVKTYHPV